MTNKLATTTLLLMCESNEIESMQWNNINVINVINGRNIINIINVMKAESINDNLITIEMK